MEHRYPPSRLGNKEKNAKKMNKLMCGVDDPLLLNKSEYLAPSSVIFVAILPPKLWQGVNLGVKRRFFLPHHSITKKLARNNPSFNIGFFHSDVLNADINQNKG